LTVEIPPMEKWA